MKKLIRKTALLCVVTMLAAICACVPATVSAADEEAVPNIWLKASDQTTGNGSTIVRQDVTGGNAAEYKGYNAAYNNGNANKLVSVRPNKVTTDANGFTMDADGVLSNTKGYADLYAPGFVMGATTDFAGKAFRADSVKFKMPADDTDAETDDGYAFLFAYDNNNYYNYYTFQNGITNNDKGFLKITGGGAYTRDLNVDPKGNYSAFIQDGTLNADAWYMAERIIDARDKSNNMQRFIIYSVNDSGEKNDVIGDSGWVKTGTHDEYISAYETYPFACLGFGAWGFPTGSKFVFDDIKCYALDSVSSTYSVGEYSQNKYLKWPDVEATHTAIYGSKAVQLHLTDEGYKANTAAEDKSRYHKFSNLPKNWQYSNKLTFEQSIYLPKLNTNELRLFNLEDENTVAGNGKTVGSVKILNGLLEVYAHNSENGYYTDKVNFNDSSESYQLEANKWYKLRWTVDQTGVNSTNYGSTDAETKVSVKAKIELMDSKGSLIKETDWYTMRDTEDYFWYGNILFFTLLQQASAANDNGYVGSTIYIDDVKVVASGEATTEKNPVTVIDEDFQQYSAGTALDTITASDKWSYHGGANKYAVVDTDLTSSVECASLPDNMKIAFGEGVDRSETEKSENVKLYKGETEVSDLIQSLSYDSETKVLTVNFKALEAGNTYTLKIDGYKTSTESKNIFSRPDSADGGYTFTIKGVPSGKVTLQSVAYQNEGGSTITGALTAGQTVKVVPVIKADSEESKSYIVIAAAYSADGQLEDVAYKDGSADLSSGTDGVVTVDGMESLTTATAGGYIKVFVWNTLSEMKPYDGPRTYPSAE